MVGGQHQVLCLNLGLTETLVAGQAHKRDGTGTTLSNLSQSCPGAMVV